MKTFPKIPGPGKAVILFVMMVLGLSFLFAPTPQPVDLSEVSFNMTSSARLYFRNVRSYYYQIKPDKASRFILYHLKAQETLSGKLHLDFTIVENPLQDEAYIFLELQGSGKQYENPHVLINTDQGLTEKWPLNGLNNEEHLKTAAALWKALLLEQKVFLQMGNEGITPFLDQPRTRKNAEIILEDYFKLIGKL